MKNRQFIFRIFTIADTIIQPAKIYKPYNQMENGEYIPPGKIDDRIHVPSVFVILVQFNNSEDVISCLKSLKEQTFSRFEVIVVDNASNSASINIINNFISSQVARNLTVTFLKNYDNLGYSGGNNIGIRYALNHGAEQILILNPDVILDGNLIQEMSDLLSKNGSLGMIGPIINESGRLVYGGKIKWLKPELKHNTKSPVARWLKPNQFLTGACLLVKREVFEKVGLFDERYFLYFEDVDLCVRTMRVGYGLALAKNAKIYHKVSATTSKLGSPRLLRYHYRNAHLFNLKHGPNLAKILLPFWSLWIIIKQLLKLIIMPTKRQVSKEILFGVLDFYRGKFGRITSDSPSQTW